MTQLYRRLFGAGAVVVAVMSASAEARADVQTGNDLYAKCGTTSGAGIGVDFCLGYIAAVADVMRYEAIAGNMACIPAGAPVGQLEDIVTRFLAAHPELWHYGAQSLVAAAFSLAFPCR
jgi:hypothetical protein